MAADIQPRSSARPVRPARVRAPRDVLGRDSLRAFDTYFANEQSNLDALASAVEEHPEFGEFYTEMLASQRRSLAELSFRIASLLPDPAPPRRAPAVLTAASAAMTAGIHAIATSVEALRARPLASGLVTGIAAVSVGAVLIAATREAAITERSPIGPRIAFAASAATGAPSQPAAIAARATAVPTPQPGVLERQRIVTIYGHPHARTMGLLGKFDDPRDAAREAKRLAAEAQAADGRPTIGALHVIVHVAQEHQTSDGTYLARLGPEELQPWVAAARDNGVLLILDTQIGWSNALTETKLLEPLLKLPFVHLALDPEFALKGQNVAPGKLIGTLDGASVNTVQAYLGDLVRREGLPRKMLMLHQFMEGMLTGTATYAPDPDIEIVVDFDGYGPVGSKIEGHAHYAVAPYAERPAMKLFTEHDEPMMSVPDITRFLRERAEALREPVPASPDVIVYQ